MFSVYKERPQSGTVFANKQEMDRLVESLSWYSRSAKDRALQGRNKLLPHRYKHRTYSSVTAGSKGQLLKTYQI